MILLTPHPEKAYRCPSAVLVFGAGMVGSTISSMLQHSAAMNSEVLPLDWHNQASFPGQLAAIEARLVEHLEQSLSAANSHGFQFLWCAGQAGFHSSESDVARELNLFEQVLRSLERLTKRLPDLPASMVLLSSAGGLFEGQRGVGIDCVPTPVRPYGRLKLQQERLLMSSPIALSRKIYRLTSVYGYIRRHHRRGLIPTLVANGLCQRPSQITGYSTTIRDYVWIEDVARHVSQAVLHGQPGNSIALLASGKPSSILEIQQIVERTIGRPLYLRFLPDVTNGVAMSFDPGILPANWFPSELSTNVRKIAVDAYARQLTQMDL